mgnify:CR=1 FL=1
MYRVSGDINIGDTYMFKYDIKKLFDEQIIKRKIDFDVDFDRWLSFLITFELIKEEPNSDSLSALLSVSGTYRITDKGIAFLTFIANRGYDMKSVGL